jgi:hypothetical protein
MISLLKQLLLLILVICKLKRNNLAFNEILILYASYVCLLHSHFIKNHPIWNLEGGALISEVVLSHQLCAHSLPFDNELIKHKSREAWDAIYEIKIRVLHKVYKQVFKQLYSTIVPRFAKNKS